MSTPQETIKMANRWPYELGPGDNPAPPDWAHATARGVIEDLADRRGIKWELEKFDLDTRKEIVASLAAIIREGFHSANA